MPEYLNLDDFVEIHCDDGGCSYRVNPKTGQVVKVCATMSLEEAPPSVREYFEGLKREGKR